MTAAERTAWARGVVERLGPEKAATIRDGRFTAVAGARGLAAVYELMADALALEEAIREAQERQP